MMNFLSGLGLGCSTINVGMEGNVLDYTLEYKLALCMFLPVYTISRNINSRFRSNLAGEVEPGLITATNKVFSSDISALRTTSSEILNTFFIFSIHKVKTGKRFSAVSKCTEKGFWDPSAESMKLFWHLPSH